MTAATLKRPKATGPDRTVLLVLFFIVTSAFLLLSHNGDMLQQLGALGNALRNPIVEALMVSLFQLWTRLKWLTNLLLLLL